MLWKSKDKSAWDVNKTCKPLPGRISGTIAPAREVGGGALTPEQTLKIVLSHLNLIVPVVAAVLVIIIAIVVVCVVRGAREPRHKGASDLQTPSVWHRHGGAPARRRGRPRPASVGPRLARTGGAGPDPGHDRGVHRGHGGHLPDPGQAEHSAPPARSEGRLLYVRWHDHRFIYFIFTIYMFHQRYTNYGLQMSQYLFLVWRFPL